MNTNVVLSTDSISVIICAYTQDRWDKLVLAVTSIRTQSHPAQEIIVVIDHNLELFAKARQELLNVRVIENTEKQGLSGARNTGITAAEGAYIAFLDDDAIAEQDWLFHMHQALTDVQVLGVGSAVIPAWEEQEPSWFPAEFYWVVGCSYLGMPRMTTPIRNPIGASMCIRREIFQAVGGFRSGIGRIGTLPLGCEETELCIRAHQYWPERYFLYLPHSSVSHFVPRKRATWRYFRIRCYAEGISKATITHFVGAKESLASERTYTLQTIPSGIIRNVGFALLKISPSYILCALAIVMGLCITTVGYLVGKYALLSSTRHVDASSSSIASSNKQKVRL